MHKIYTDPIIVIIATSMARTNVLLERALKSVYNQENINPHQIYIVNDNDINNNKEYSDEYYQIKKGVKELRQTFLKPKFEQFKKENNIPNLKFDNFFHTTIIKNTRTKGFSGTGAWNTAAFKALQYSDRKYFLAFLDDDDEWEKDYLEKLYRKTKEIEKRKSLTGKIKDITPVAVISGINRIEKDKTVKILCQENDFTRESFFIKNPGLQGSNLFIELKTFWTIGGFDESLKSATDRDLAIRLIDYVKLRKSKSVKFIDKYLVNHYADNEKRVTAITENKKQGLDTFYRKYLHQFPKEIQDKSLERAKKLFNYTLPKLQSGRITQKKLMSPQHNKNQTPQAINLIIGTISNNSVNLRELFKSFLGLLQKYGNYLNDYKFVVLENTTNEYEIRPIINYFKHNKKLKIEIITNNPDIHSIAENRTYLQKKIYKIGKNLFNSDFISWIIDDDCLFKTDTFENVIIPNYFMFISQLSKQNIDAIFGQVSDAPPLPFLSTLRTQLIDFYYNLTYFANCNPKDKFELNSLQNINIERDEFYYDLSSKNYQHLEYPYYQHFNGLTNKEAFKNFLKETALLSKGVNVFRKLYFEEQKIGTLTKPSIYRGGNTIIFNPELLKTPNYTPEKEYNRRSDFNWAIINKYIYNYKLYEAILPLEHDRKLQNTPLSTNETKLQADIKGLIFYRLFENILSKENWENKTEHKNELRYYKRIKNQTFRKIKINNYRTQNLIHLILEILKDKKKWWFQNEYRAEINYDIQQNIFTLEFLRIELGKRKFQILIQDLENKMKIDNDFINRVITKMKEIKGDNKSHT